MARYSFQRVVAFALSALMAGQLMLTAIIPTPTAAAIENDTNTMNQVADSNTGYENNAMIQLTKTTGITIGTAGKDGGAVENIAYNSDNKTAYVINGQEGTLNFLP